MKYRRKIFQRAAALLCCILVLSAYLVVPASAESSDDGFFDVLQFGTANGSGYQYVNGTFPFDVVYQTTQNSYYYVDMVVTCSYLLQVYYGGTQLTRQIINYNNGIPTQRFYGDLVGDPSGYLTFRFDSAGHTGAVATVIFNSLRVSLARFSYEPATGAIKCDNSVFDTVYKSMDSAYSPVKLFLNQYSGNYYYPYTAYVKVNDWKKYDYVDIFLNTYVTSIDSIGAYMNSSNNSYVSLPYTVNDISYDFEDNGSINPDVSIPYDTQRFILVRIDLTGVDRSDSFEPFVIITGKYNPYYGDNYIQLYSVTGSIFESVPSDLATFWQRLQGLLVALFGSDPAAGAANQQQQEYNNDSQEIVIDAVSNWDGNIEYAEAGFNDSIQFVTPSIAWMSTLASKVYNNLGVFRSLYLLVGLMSVIMLILSKSGVAAKISHSFGRSSGGGGKRA